jgi:Transposase DDE domain group 1
VILRPGKTPAGAEVALVLRQVVKAIRARCSTGAPTQGGGEILVRGDSPYARPEAMTWCERHRIGSVFGLAGNQVLLARIAALAEDAAVSRVQGDAETVRRFGGFRYAARSWHAERRGVARIDASPRAATAASSSPSSPAHHAGSTRASTASAVAQRT